MTSICHCGQPIPFEVCCGPYLGGAKTPDTAEKLMRSRYSAFVTHNADYLCSTHHPSTRAANLQNELIQSFPQQTWRSLRIVQSHQQSSHGQVEFVAFSTPTDHPNDGMQLHELSDFLKEDGRWYYVKGKHLPDIKIGRNDLCWCNSGKKFKKCHA